MAHWQQAPPVPQAMRSDVRVYMVLRCTRGPDETPCRDVVYPGEYQYDTPCPICTRVNSALFQRLEHNLALERAVEALHPDMPLLQIGEHWNPAIPQPQLIQQAQVPRDPVARPKVKAYMMRPGVNQALRAPADAVRQPPPPPPPPQQPKVPGGVQVVGIASVPISPARGSYGPARVAVVRTPPPPPPPPVGATPPHAVPGGKVPSLVPLVGAMPPHAGQSKVSSYIPASGLQGPASGSHGVARLIQPQPVWVPPEPAGPPPPRQASEVVDLTVTRRGIVSGETYQQAKALSATLHIGTGSVLLEAVHAVGQSEIASTVDGDGTVPITGEALENNLSAYLQAVCAGDERPVSSHPMRLAKALVIGALRDRQSDFSNVGQGVADLPDNSQDDNLQTAIATMRRWRDFVIYLATLVASVFEPMRFDACIRESCAMDDEGLPDETCWRRALNYVTLTAARFQFIRLLVLPVVLYDRCRGERSCASRTDIGHDCSLRDLVGVYSCGQA